MNEPIRDADTGMIIWSAALIGFVRFICLLFGRAQKAGPVIPQRDPPAGVSPGLAAYIRSMGRSDNMLTAKINQIAVLGAVRIMDDEKTVITKTDDFGKVIALSGALSEHSPTVAQELFPNNAVVGSPQSSTTLTLDSHATGGQ